MSVAPHAGIIDFGTFTPPTISQNGIQGEVPAPLVTEIGYFLSTSGWVPNPSSGQIGGYPVVLTNPQPYDVLMFGVNQWVNTPQIEITNGGNF